VADSNPPEQTPEIKIHGGPLSVILPPDAAIAAEAQRLISDQNLRVEDLSICVSQDPIIVLELLKTGNAMFFSGGRPPITSPKTAIVRLGQQHTKELLEEIISRPQNQNLSVQAWIDTHRSRCKRTSIVARMLSEVVIKNFSDECQVAGLLYYLGEMIAAAHFKDEYIKLAEEQTRASVNYRLAQDHKFDVEKINLAYLRRFGIPEIILFALDRDALNRQPERAAMKPVIMAADEMVESFDANRWDKLAPGKQLPSKSSLRLLQISDSQYARIYERASEYLFSMRILEEKRRQKHKNATQEILAATTSSAESDSVASWSIGQEESLDISSSLQAEIDGLIDALSEPVPEIPQPVIQKPAAKSSPTPTPPARVTREEFAISKSMLAEKPARVVSPTRKSVTPPTMANASSAKAVSKFAATIEEATDAEGLLRDLLSMLVGQGLFQKSALIVVSKDKSKALVVAARGPNITNGQTIIITDPLSPLAECFSKVQSFGNKESKVSPFGSKAFALSPIDAPHDTPVALYADCGNEGAIPFEARRIFRNVIDILNEKLPYLPGSIPVEI
jgi:HD-like signal output (HDOD) protein